MFNSKRAFLGFVLGMGLSTLMMAYGLLFLLTGRLLLPSGEGAVLMTPEEAATRLEQALQSSTEGSYGSQEEATTV